ncbi:MULTISPECIES: DMT family transporter [unclassified Oscillibacter]|uniref:DMT family transporter n=1 Tax=unclassified Oscillibacter TaxID=2629304 RepID=UPI0025E00BAA|nr:MULTISPECIES: DMT family transporter [unclassified Oscillibacter]
MERQSDTALAENPEAFSPPWGDILDAPDAPIPDLGERSFSENCAEYALDECPEYTQKEYPECVPEECLEEDSSPSTDAPGADGQPPDAASSSAPHLTPRLAVGLILLQSLFFGFGDPISKNAFSVVPVFTLLFVRYLLALLTLFVFSGRRIAEGLRRCRVRDWIGSALCIALASVVGNVAITLPQPPVWRFSGPFPR